LAYAVLQSKKYLQINEHRHFLAKRGIMNAKKDCRLQDGTVIQKNTGRHEGESKVNIKDVPVEEMPDLSKTDMQELSRIQKMDSLYGGLDQCNVSGAVEEIEALEYANSFAERFDVEHEDVRPCIASIFYQGVTTERNPYAFVLALEMHCIGCSENKLHEMLRDFNSHLSRRLRENEIHGILRRVTSDRYDKPYGCKHYRLSYFCIGDICPWKKARGLNGKIIQKSVLSAFIKLGWTSYISDPYLTQIYIGLQRLRMLKGYAPGAIFSFKYERLERESGIRRRNLTSKLADLLELGLISDLEIGSKWGEEKKRTKLRIVHPVPDPKRLKLKPVFLRK